MILHNIVKKKQFKVFFCFFFHIKDRSLPIPSETVYICPSCAQCFPKILE